MEFDDEGLPMPPGEASIDKEDFESLFSSLEKREHRESLIASWNLWMKEMSKIVTPDSWHQLIGGSFTTKKEMPLDIDVVSLLDHTSMNELALYTHPYATRADGTAENCSKERYKIDSYFVPVYPKTDPRFRSVTLKAIDYWKKLWSVSRTSTPRAFFQIKII